MIHETVRKRRPYAFSCEHVQVHGSDIDNFHAGLKGAMLTLPAACASSDHHGFLYGPNAISTTAGPSNPLSRSWLARGTKDNFVEPIHTGRWTLQDLVLSKRILR